LSWVANGSGTGLGCSGTCTTGAWAQFTDSLHVTNAGYTPLNPASGVTSTCTKPTFSGGQAVACTSATASDVGAVAANASVTGATKTKITYDSKGLVTAGSDATAADVGAVAANTAITGATKTKITYDAKGLVTAGADATAADVGALPTSAVNGTSGYIARFTATNAVGNALAYTATPTAGVIPASDGSGKLTAWVDGILTTQWLDTPSGATINPDSAWHALTTDTWTLVGTIIEVEASAVFSSPYDATYCGLAIYADNGTSATTYRGVQDWVKGPTIPGLSGTLGTAHSHAMITGLSGTVTVSVKSYAVGNSCDTTTQVHVKVWK
jgi:hypothetical protein